MRIFFGIWSLLFVVSALVQINDPDPLIWVSIYLIAAVLSAMAAMRRYPLLPLAIGTGLSLIGVIYYFPPSVGEWIAQEWQQQDLTMKTMAMEEARESFGLMLVFIVLSIALIIGWKRKARHKHGV